MTAWLRSQGYAVKHERVRRRRQLGLDALYVKPRLSQPAAGHAISPDLWRGLRLVRVKPVWSADITSIRLQPGYVYLVAVMDWFRRDVLSWAVSITMDVQCCLAALDQALQQGQPEIFNTDQGAQCPSQVCTARLKAGGVRISLDGRGRALDHVFVERLWRTVKDEEGYVRAYHSTRAARQGWTGYCGCYNEERWHQALGDRTPAAVSRGSGKNPPNGHGRTAPRGGPSCSLMLPEKWSGQWGYTSLLPRL